MMLVFRNFIVKYRLEIIAALLTLFCAMVLFGVSNLRFSNDDQFIHYRYIDNIALGNGFVYNHGERVLGTTTPLFTLLMAGLKHLFRSIYTPDLVAYANIFLLSTSAIFFARLCRRLLGGKRIILVITAVAVFAFNMARTIPEGMESPLFVLTLLIFLESLSVQRFHVSALFLSFLILIRPDAGLIAVLAFIYWWKKTHFQNAVRLALLSAVITLPWLIFSTLYFGSFLPQSFLAKIHTNDIINQSAAQAFKVQLAHLSRVYWGKIIDPNNIAIQSLFNLLPFMIFVFVAVIKKLNKDNWIVFTIPLLYFISFSLANPIMFPWYLTQLEPLWLIISFLGFSVFFDKLKYHWMRILAIGLILIGPLYFWARGVATPDQGSKMPLFTIGEYLKTNVLKGERVGVNNIGIIGYVSGAYIIDLFGLVNEVSPAFYPVIDCADRSIQYLIPPALIDHFHPEWLVISNESELTPCFRESRWFADNYTLAHRVGTGRIFKSLK
jgi:hypothetical protein